VTSVLYMCFFSQFFFVISFKAGTQTQSDVTVVAVITCLSAFLLSVFVSVGAADLALAGRTQFLFS